MTSENRKLHHAAVGAEALDALRQLFVPPVVIAFVGGSRSLGTVLFFGIAGIGVAVVGAFVTWSSTWWAGRDGSVRLRTGMFRERTTTIPFDRVQSFDTVRGPIQRLFGVVALHVQTAV